MLSPQTRAEHKMQPFPGFPTWQGWKFCLHPVAAELKAPVQEQGPQARGEAVVQRRRPHAASPPGVILGMKHSK